MTEALVIGGGPSGTALAILLSRVGKDVVLLEREAAPSPKVCGEFLSSEAMTYLASLGIDLAALGAVPIDAVRWVTGEHIATSQLPFAAVGLSRQVLDEALLARATQAGAVVRRGVAVQSLSRAGEGWVAQLSDGSEIGARAAFVATGKHDLRGWKRSAGVQNDLVAFKLHWQLSPAQTAALDGHVELILFRGGYAGLQLVEGGRANLCLVIRRARLHALGRWSELLASLRVDSPHLRARLSDAVPSSNRPASLGAIPYGYVRRQSEGLWRLGDQAAVIPSFSGDGMSIALHSGRLAAASYLQGHDADSYQRLLAHDVGGQVHLATALSLGMVRRPIQRALGAAVRLWPGLIGSVADRTRVPHPALARLAAA